jgi:hypothetical protein
MEPRRCRKAQAAGSGSEVEFWHAEQILRRSLEFPATCWR